MKNIEALKTTCNAIANTFYPDEATLELTLFNEGVNAQATAQPKDKTILRLAIRLVIGYVESSRNEGEYSEASYTVLLETMGRVIPTEIKTVKLERFDEDLGEFTVRSMEYVSGHGRMRITV